MPKKDDFPVSPVRRYLEPSPIVLVSSRSLGENNAMTMGWHYTGDGVFMVAGKIIDRKSQFSPGMLRRRFS